MELSKAKKYLLEAARLVVPAGRVLFYEVDRTQRPFGHISSSSDEYWGDLYNKFADLDPFHPRRFSSVTGNVFGTAPGFSFVPENAQYIRSFRLPLGVRYKAEVFMRNAQGRICGGLRFVRFDQEREFSAEEMAKLEKMQPLFASSWCASLTRSKEVGILTGLTEREHEVLELLLSGYPNQDISRQLSIALPTVKNHVRNILNKTGYANRTELLSALFRAGDDARSLF